MHKYRELKVWQRSLALTVKVYQETRRWPPDERFGLISQTRRASYSIPLNIAEGSGSSSSPDFCRFLEYALKSDYELMTAIDIANGLGFLSNEDAKPFLDEADEIAAMITGLMKSLGWRENPV